MHIKIGINTIIQQTDPYKKFLLFLVFKKKTHTCKFFFIDLGKISMQDRDCGRDQIDNTSFTRGFWQSIFPIPDTSNRILNPTDIKTPTNVFNTKSYWHPNTETFNMFDYPKLGNLNEQFRDKK